MNLRLRPFSTSLTLSLLLAATTATAAAPFNRVRVPTGAQSSTAPPPALELSGVGSSLDFGQVQVAQQLTSNTLVVSNKGKGAATALGVVAPAGFDVVDNDCGTELKPGSSCSFAVTFAPAQARAYSDSVTVESGNGVAALLRVDGVGVGAAVKLSDINFGDMLDGAQLVQAAVLRNTGVGSVQLYAPNVSGPGFTLAAGGTCGPVLAAGASCLINVRLTAAGVTAHVGTLTMPTVDAGNLQASLSGQSRKTFNVNTTVATSGSVTIPAGVTSVTLVGKGGAGYNDYWYNPGQSYIAATAGQPYIAGQAYQAAVLGWAWSFPQMPCSPVPNGTEGNRMPNEPPAAESVSDTTWYSNPFLVSRSGGTSLCHYVYIKYPTTITPEKPYIAEQPYIAPTSGQAYIAPTSGGGPKTGASSTATLGGYLYTFAGGYNTGGAATALTYTKTLTAGSAQTLSFTIGSGGSLNYKYSYTLPY